MSEITAKVVEILATRKWDGDRGTVYYQTLKMDNGDTGSIGKKTENHFKVGDSITYTKHQRGEYTDFKEVRSGGGFGGGGRGGGGKSNPQVALECATRVFLERNRVNPVETETAKIGDGIVTLANKFNDWLATK